MMTHKVPDSTSAGDPDLARLFDEITTTTEDPTPPELLRTLSVAKFDAQEERILQLEESLRDCTNVMSRHIYPKPDAEAGSPWAILQRARQLLNDKDGGSLRADRRDQV